MKYMKLIGLLVIMLFLVGCNQGDLTGSTVSDAVSEAAEAVEEVVEEAGEAVEEFIPEYDAEVEELVEKGSAVDNYQYSYSSSIRGTNGVYYTEPTYVAYVKGDKVKKAYLSPIKIGSTHYSDIYLIDGKAFGSCSDNAVVCEENDMAMGLSYSTHALKEAPLVLIQDVPYDATVVGSETFDGRKLKIVEFGEDDQMVRLSVDPYYGLPLKKIVYVLEEGEKVIMEKYYFENLAVDKVKNSDVSLD